MTNGPAPLTDERLAEIRDKESRNLAKIFDSTVTELLAEVDRLRAALDDANRLADYYHEDRDAAAGFWEDSQAEVNRLLERINAVKALHTRNAEGGQGWGRDGSYTEIAPACPTCGTMDEYAVEWPCATALALGEDGGTDG